MSSIATLLQAAEYIESKERSVRKKLEDLPEEMVLKILSYADVKDLISCGQVSKRTRNVSQDGSLWVTANLAKKIVKVELLELILNKGCKILNISNSTIVGRLSSNIENQLRVLNLSQSNSWGRPTLGADPVYLYHKENIDTLERLLFSCSFLQRLEMRGLCITSIMAVSICKNGKTLQALNLNNSCVYQSAYPFGANHIFDNTVPNGNLQAIIKCCQELKEVDLNYINGSEGLTNVDIELLTNNITPNVEKLNLRNHDFEDDEVKLLLSRCNKIKALSLEAFFMSDDSFTYIRQYLNLTLEELSLRDDGTGTEDGNDISFAGFLKLKTMPRLKILKLYDKEDDCVAIHCLRHHLPHMKISGAIKYVSNVFNDPNVSNVSNVFNDPNDSNDSSDSSGSSDSSDSSDSND